MDVSALNKAVTMMCIALPVMFFVIGIFIFATKLLHKTFPAPAEEDED
jgi:uncharacterized membrane protein YhdT